MDTLETTQTTALAKAKARINELPEAIQLGLRAQQQRTQSGVIVVSPPAIKLTDHELFAIVITNGISKIEMFNKTLNEGLATNIHQGTIPADMHFLLTSIVVQSCSAVATIALASALSFSSPDPILRNAKFTMKCGKDVFFDKCSGGIFQIEKANLEHGEYQVECPRWMSPLEPLSFEFIELGAILTATTWVKLRLRGVCTTKK